jgi:hypothetical protein
MNEELNETQMRYNYIYYIDFKDRLLSNSLLNYYKGKYIRYNINKESYIFKDVFYHCRNNSIGILINNGDEYEFENKNFLFTFEYE